MRQPPAWRLLLVSAALTVGAAACSDPEVDTGGTEEPSASADMAAEDDAAEASPSEPDGAAAVTDAPPPAIETMVEGVLTACVAATPDVAESVDGDWEGFDVAVLEGVAGELGLDLELVDSSFDEIVSGVALNGGACEVAAAAVVDRDPLEAVVRTSAPYRTVHRLVVATEAGEAAQVAPEAVTGTVGVEEGGTATDAVDALTAAEVVAYPSGADLGRALAEGAVAAALVSVSARAEMESLLGTELALRAAVPTEEETVLLLPLGADDDVVEAVDGALATLRDTGQLAALRDQWLRA